jgi:hypothetical protein
VDDVAASRRRVGFALLLSASFVVALAVGLTTTASTHPLRVEAAADAATVAAPSTTARPAPTSTSTTAPRRRAATSSTPPDTTSVASSSTLEHAVALASHPVVAATPATTEPPVTSPPATEPPAPPVPPSAAAFLACIRERESHDNYGAVSADGVYRGAYQFSQASWNVSAAHAGRSDLVGRLPNLVAPADQDAVALALYEWQGSAPWGGACG